MTSLPHTRKNNFSRSASWGSRALLIACSFTLVCLISGCQSQKLKLPPLPANLDKNSYYKTEFLSDGFPGKRINGKLRPHLFILFTSLIIIWTNTNRPKRKNLLDAKKGSGKKPQCVS